MILRAAAALFFAAISSAFAVGTLIPAPGRVDMVHDFTRDIIYITSGDSVLRYSLETRSFLPPIVLGGQLMGIDISPNGRYLAVADDTRTDSQVWIQIVDLEAGTSRKLYAPRAFYEGGTFTVAFGNTGWVLVSSTFEGSGWTPLRRFNPDTGEVVQLPEVRQDTMLAASGDRTRLGFAESNISDGEWGRYTFTTDAMERRQGYTDGTSWFNFEIGTNRDGSQFAIPTYGGTFFYNDTFAKVATIGTYAGASPIGVAYHPLLNRAFFPFADTRQVKVYDTNTFTEIGSYDFENDFTWTGNWAFQQGRTKISVDGALLMVTVAGGVRFHYIENVLHAADLQVLTALDTPASIALKGTSEQGGVLAYSIIAQPAHGAVTLNGSQALYTPARGFRGKDTFDYRVTYGQAAAEATVTVIVGQRPPVASDTVAMVLEDQYTYVVLRAVDPDGDPLTYSIVSGPKHGTLSGSGRTMTYTPAANFNGIDTFTYQVNDGFASSNVAKGTITVVSINDPPVANPDFVTVARRTKVTVPVLANDTDADGDKLAVTAVGRPTAGTASLANGVVSYTAPPTPGTYWFTYTITDHKGGTAIGLVTVTVN